MSSLESQGDASIVAVIAKLFVFARRGSGCYISGAGILVEGYGFKSRTQKLAATLWTDAILAALSLTVPIVLLNGVAGEISRTNRKLSALWYQAPRISKSRKWVGNCPLSGPSLVFALIYSKQNYS